MRKLFLLLFAFTALNGQSQNKDPRHCFVDSLLTDIKADRNIRYNTTERPLLMDVYYPHKVIASTLPCVVWIHGGALTDTSITKDYDLVKWGIARTVASGFISVSIDYRLITESPLPAAIQDCETAIRFLKSNASKFNIDTNRIAVVGESAGGFLAGFCSFACNTGIFSTSEWSGASNRIACGVLWYPAINHSPYNMLDYISPDDIPVISIHGDADGLVPIDRSYQIEKRCREKGLDFNLYVIRNAQHGFFDESWSFTDTYRRNMEQAITITIDFLNSRLRKF